MFKTITALGAAALAAFTLAAPAAASPVGEDNVVVGIAGLDLARPSDAARLDMRLRRAAEEVCGTADGRDLRLSGAVAACRTEAIARARADVEIAMRSGGSRVVALRTN
jgi:UrcA family protein